MGNPEQSPRGFFIVNKIILHCPSLVTVLNTIELAREKTMRKKQPSISKHKLTGLRQQLPLFRQALKDPVANEDFDGYLSFYQLPTNSDGTKLFAGTTEDKQTVVMSWQPKSSRGNVLVVHGYMDHTGLYGHLIRHLLSRQYRVICLDLKGHGLSAGMPFSIDYFDEYVSQIEEVLTVCKDSFDGSIHGIGQSMGGAILMQHNMHHGHMHNYGFQSLTLLAPLLRPFGWQKSRWIYYFSRHFTTTIKRAFRPSSWDQQFLDFLRYQDPLQPIRVPVDWIGAMDRWIQTFEQSAVNDFPIHIIQGDQDKTLDWRDNLEKFAQKYSAITATVIPEANHHLVNEKASLREVIFASIKL